MKTAEATLLYFAHAVAFSVFSDIEELDYERVRDKNIFKIDYIQC